MPTTLHTTYQDETHQRERLEIRGFGTTHHVSRPLFTTQYVILSSIYRTHP